MPLSGNTVLMEDCMSKKYDVIIIGSGVVGSMVARFLSKYQLASC